MINGTQLEPLKQMISDIGSKAEPFALIRSSDHASLMAVIAMGTAASIWLEQNYRWAARLSGPVLALVIGMILSNTGVIPMDAPAYGFVGKWLVMLAIPLLLFRASFREIIRTGGPLMAAFHLSALGTMLGTVIALPILGADIMGPGTGLKSPELEQTGGIMTASFMGGSVNFIAVKESYDVSEQITNPLIVADNFVMAAMFIALLTIGTSNWFKARFRHAYSADTDKFAAKNLAAEHWKRKEISLQDVAWSFGFAFCALALAYAGVKLMNYLSSELLNYMYGKDAPFPSGWLSLQELVTNKYVLLTVITLFMATILAKPLKKINGPEEFGSYLLAMFLFTLGPPADLMKVLKDAPLFFVFCGVIAIINLLFTLGVGKILRLNLEELVVAVNATLGGPPSAAAMAVSGGWPKLVLPGILVGVWGYVIGTPCALLLTDTLIRLGWFAGSG